MLDDNQNHTPPDLHLRSLSRSSTNQIRLYCATKCVVTVFLAINTGSPGSVGKHFLTSALLKITFVFYSC